MFLAPDSYQRVAVVLAPRLGDSLLMMTVAQNLRQAGKDVVIFGTYLLYLAPWFPGFDLRPALTESAAAQQLQGFDLVLHMHDAWPFDLRPYHEHVVSYDEVMPLRTRGIVKLHHIADFCRQYLGLQQAGIDNGLRDIDAAQYRRHAQRVVIHTTSTSTTRRWSPERFMKLGLALKKQGFEPAYIVGPEEYAQWAWLKQHGLDVPEFASLLDLAHYIHASGWLIGNESGIGHLASNLGIPTLWISGRGKRLKMWRPAWSPAKVLYPWYLPGSVLRDRYWREAIPVALVMLTFAALRKAALTGLTPPPAIVGPEPARSATCPQ